MYKVNEIFYSLQGEGRNTGRAAVFVRFSGCNLHCTFCDTDFTHYETLSAEQIVNRMREICAEADCEQPFPMVVLTGGEPTLQVDSALIRAIHAAGFSFVAMESNGTALPPANLDWLTVSPKAPEWLAAPAHATVAVRQCNELKVVFDGQTPVSDLGIQAQYYYLQPCDVGDANRNAEITSACIAFIKQHPRWRLSLQTHKLVGIR